MGALASAFALVFLAELGDKSMLFVLAIATRVRAAVLFPVIAVSAALLMAVAVVAGGVAGDVLPRRPVEIGAALVFVAVGVWTLRDSFAEGATEVPDDGEEQSRRGVSALLARVRRFDAAGAPLPLGAALAGAFFIAEFGDKTQLAAISLASVDPREGALVWAGATAGMTAADAIAMVAGARLARLLPPLLVERVAGILFVFAGLTLLGFAAF